MSSDIIISVRQLHKSYDDTPVLQGVTLDVARGQTVVLIGKSGSGKSTMLRCLNLLEDWQQGEIIVEGKPLGLDKTADGKLTKWSGRRQAEARMRIGMVFQQFNLFPHMTALENVMVGPREIKGADRRTAEDLAMRLLTDVGLSEKRDQYPAHLSGGQQQRVAIARALAMEPHILLLDEITSALDPELVGEVLDVVADLKTRGLTMVFVTHEIQFAHEVADQVFFLDLGRVLEHGSPSEVLDNPKTEQLQRFLSRFSAYRGRRGPIGASGDR
jgi:polar amino acid transport system ATP-binding protein